jgi:hypothetical protein
MNPIYITYLNKARVLIKIIFGKYFRRRNEDAEYQRQLEELKRKKREKDAVCQIVLTFYYFSKSKYL